MRQMLPLHSFAALSFTARSFPVRSLIHHSSTLLAIVALFLLSSGNLVAQGVTTGGVEGAVTDDGGRPLTGASITAVHVPSGTTYQTLSRTGGVYTIPGMRVGGPYSVTASIIGYTDGAEDDVNVALGQDRRVDFILSAEAIQLEALRVEGTQDDVLNSSRTGAETLIPRAIVETQPTVKRTTRDLIKNDPRSDGNYAFGGRNWLYNNITLDGSYFSNPFGLDDPAPGGQTASEPVPFDAVEQVHVAVAPFDVRQSGFTGANINTVTKSGTNKWRGTVYTFFRNQDMQGNKIDGNEVVANPDLQFNQTGFSIGGPILRDKLFVFLNAEMERRDDPGSNFVPSDGTPSFGESRVQQSVLDEISTTMLDQYGYTTGPYSGYVNETNNDKLLVKLDYNVNENHNLSFRYNYLNADRDLQPHPFVLSFNGSGRGPNETSLPSQNSGYQINNELSSFALELNSRGDSWANRFFGSYNRFRDYRIANSVPYPTIEIGEQGVTYTTVGHEPFSIGNNLDQDVWQFQNDYTRFLGRHTLTLGASYERYGFFNSFNIFRYGLFMVPAEFGGTTFSSLDQFRDATDPNSPNYIDFNSFVGTGEYKGENIDLAQASVYLQDDWEINSRFTLTMGLRMDLPQYITDPVDNAWSRSLPTIDGDGTYRATGGVDQSNLPGGTPLWSPRVGFNYAMNQERTTQLRGGTGIFTGRIPFVWAGNVISNPGANPNIWGPFNPGPDQVVTSAPRQNSFGEEFVLQQSFDLNAMTDDFKWPQLWISDIAIDHVLPGNILGTFEFLYGKDLNSIVMYNYDLDTRGAATNPIDGRPYYGGAGNNELTPDGAGIYTIGNTSDGWNYNLTAQLRKVWESGLGLQLSYNYANARNQLKSTEIASVLWQENPIQGNPNSPATSFSQFNQRHRIVATGTYVKRWSEKWATHFGLYFEVAEGNRNLASGGNRYSFIYSGDVNGDGTGSNDLIYVPSNQSEIRLVDYTNASGQLVSAAQQWTALDAFIEQDKYLSQNRGEITERFGLLNPWYQTLDLRILQDFIVPTGSRESVFQLSLDFMNFLNMFNSSWGVRQIASPAATSPLTLVGFEADGVTPQFTFNMIDRTFLSDPGIASRWQIQVGIRYLLN